MSNDELPRAPRGQISIGGDLASVMEGEFRIQRGKKLKYSLRKGGLPAAITSGNQEASGSFKCFVDEDGREKDWPTLVNSFKNMNFYYKSPKTTDTFIGQITSAVCRFTGEDGIEFDIEFIGFRVET